MENIMHIAPSNSNIILILLLYPIIIINNARIKVITKKTNLLTHKKSILSFDNKTPEI